MVTRCSTSSRRVGVLDGRWRVARHDGTRWRTLAEGLEHVGDIDVVAERRRLVSWWHELLGYRSGWLDRDHAAEAEARLVFDLTIGS